MKKITIGIFGLLVVGILSAQPARDQKLEPALSPGPMSDTTQLGASGSSFLLSSCSAKLPEDVGKDAAKGYFLADGSTVLLSKESGGRVLPAEFLRGPGGNLGLKFRNGTWWSREGLVVRKWEASLNSWLVKFRAPGPFDAFDVAFDESILLFGLQDEKNHEEISEIELFTSEQSHRTLLEWPKSQKAKRDAFLGVMDRRNVKVFPYDEYLLVFFPLTGRALLIDSVDWTLRTLDVPWADLPEVNGKAQAFAVPRCVQWIVAPNHALVMVYDNNSRFSSEAEQKQIKDLKEKGKTDSVPQEWKALRLNLVSRDWSKLELPADGKFPFWSLDGYTLTELSKLPVQLAGGKRLGTEVKPQSKDSRPVKPKGTSTEIPSNPQKAVAPKANPAEK